MSKIVVNVMLQREIRAPRGEAISCTCHRLGFGEVTRVCQGKPLEAELSGPPAQPL